MPRIELDECAICGSSLRLTFLAPQAEAFSFRPDGGPAGGDETEELVICRPCKEEFSPASARPRPGPPP